MTIPLENTLGRAAYYTGNSVSTCMRAEATAKATFTQASRKKRSDSYVVDSSVHDVVKRTVHDMILRGKGVPTAISILREVQEKITFPGKLTFLRSTINEIGFSWKKCGSNRSILMERTDVVVARTRFLREMLRDEDRCNIYTDETYVLTTQCMKNAGNRQNSSLKFPAQRASASFSCILDQRNSLLKAQLFF